MHCPICDREDDTISYDKVTGTFGDCSVCREAIDECLGEYDQDDDPELA